LGGLEARKKRYGLKFLAGQITLATGETIKATSFRGHHANVTITAPPAEVEPIDEFGTCVEEKIKDFEEEEGGLVVHWEEYLFFLLIVYHNEEPGVWWADAMSMHESCVEQGICDSWVWVPENYNGVAYNVAVMKQAINENILLEGWGICEVPEEP
jgi:hypothetical protein